VKHSVIFYAHVTANEHVCVECILHHLHKCECINFKNMILHENSDLLGCDTVLSSRVINCSG
jgi:hypothetical protein